MEVPFLYNIPKLLIVLYVKKVQIYCLGVYSMILIYSFLALIFLIVLYITIKFVNKPLRKLKSAQKRKAFYMLDDPADVRVPGWKQGGVLCTYESKATLRTL